MINLAIVCLAAAALLYATRWGWRLRTTPLDSGPDSALLAKSLESRVCKLSREIGSRNTARYAELEQAAAYITAELRSFGYEVETQTYAAAGKQVKNIIVEKKGCSNPGEIIIAAAHYDTHYNPGADDNASGIAAVLELAKLFKSVETARTVRFVAFANEEPPFFDTSLMGSRVYADSLKSKNENVRAALVFEMVGFFSDKPFSQKYPPLIGLLFPNRGDFIAIVGDMRSGSLARTAGREFKKQNGVAVEAAALPSFIRGIRLSDHASFWRAGYPAVMITDTAFYRNANYHKNTDTWDTLNYRRMAGVVTGAFHALKKLAG